LKTVLLVLAGFIAGLGIAFWWQPRSEPSVEAEAAASVARSDLRAGLAEARLDALGGEPRQAPREIGSDRVHPPFIDRARRDGAETQDQRLAVDLIVAGFAPDRAEWINRRIQELRMQAMQAQSEARREGRPPHADVETATLRTELGDQDYERFLIARGVPTRVNIMSVLASSPAERAGMQRGDEISSYDGKRVFNVPDLNELALGGTSGESVVVDVRRNGENLRFVLPRGPLGVLSGYDVRGPPRGLQR
jgi:membrane-associated protease RseP (regulator of RpoE activity)